MDNLQIAALVGLSFVTGLLVGNLKDAVAFVKSWFPAKKKRKGGR